MESYFKQSKNNAMNLINFESRLSQFIFFVSLMSYLGLFVTDVKTNGFASLFFDLNYLLILALITGILAIFQPLTRTKK